MRIKLDVLAAVGMAATIKLRPRETPTLTGGSGGTGDYEPGSTAQDAHLLHETLRTILPYVTYLELQRIFEERRHHD